MNSVSRRTLSKARASVSLAVRPTYWRPEVKAAISEILASVKKDI